MLLMNPSGTLKLTYKSYLAECCCSLMLLLPLGCSSAIDKLDQVSFLINWSNDLIFSQITFLSPQSIP